MCTNEAASKAACKGAHAGAAGLSAGPCTCGRRALRLHACMPPPSACRMHACVQGPRSRVIVQALLAAQAPQRTGPKMRLGVACRASREGGVGPGKCVGGEGEGAAACRPLRSTCLSSTHAIAPTSQFDALFLPAYAAATKPHAHMRAALHAVCGCSHTLADASIKAHAPAMHNSDRLASPGCCGAPTRG